jgi:osmoprotectant transport system substrate-binding protein
MNKNNRTAYTTRLAAGLSLALVVAACGSKATTSPSGSNASIKPVTIADKGFTESRVVTQVYRQALESAGFPVTVKSLTSTALADGAIRKGEIDMYSEYTGTILTSLLQQATPPTDVAAQVAEIKAKYASTGLTVLDAAPFNNDNEVACTKDAVAKYALTDLSSLGKASPEIVYSANPEHTTRPDGLPLLEKEYGIKFRSVVTVDIGLRYKPIEEGNAQCVYAFGTDPKVASNNLVVLKDDKGKFQGAPYNGIPVVSEKYLSAATPLFAQTVNKVSATLTSEEVRKMNASVDLDKKDPDQVAKAFLVDKSLIKS